MSAEPSVLGTLRDGIDAIWISFSQSLWKPSNV